jgi:hypothetical protein
MGTFPRNSGLRVHTLPQKRTQAMYSTTPRSKRHWSKFIFVIIFTSLYNIAFQSYLFNELLAFTIKSTGWATNATTLPFLLISVIFILATQLLLLYELKAAASEPASISSISSVFCIILYLLVSLFYSICGIVLLTIEIHQFRTMRGCSSLVYATLNPERYTGIQNATVKIVDFFETYRCSIIVTKLVIPVGFQYSTRNFTAGAGRTYFELNNINSTLHSIQDALTAVPTLDILFVNADSHQDLQPVVPCQPDRSLCIHYVSSRGSDKQGHI